MTTNQFGMNEVQKLSMNAYGSNKPFIFAEHAEMSENNVTHERLEWRGGAGMYLLMAKDHSKKMSVKFTFSILDIILIAAINGSEVVKGAEDVFQRDVLQVDSNNQITLTKTPKSSMYMFQLVGDRDFGDEITEKAGVSLAANEYEAVTGGGAPANTYQLDATSNPEGSFVVVTYMYATPNTARSFTIPVNKFASVFTLQCEGLWTNPQDTLDYVVKATFFKALPKGNLSLKFGGNEATKQDIEFDLMPQRTSVVDGVPQMDYAKYVVLSN